MGTGAQFAVFVVFSPLWILGMLLMVVGWRRQAKGRATLTAGNDLVFEPVDDGRARLRARGWVVAGRLMVVLSIAPLGLFLWALPRASIPVFFAVAFWRWRVSKRAADLPPPPKANDWVSSAPLAPVGQAVSGSRFALGYALPVLVAVVVATSWSSVAGTGMWLFFSGCFAPILPLIFESSRPHRGAVLAIGEVIGHERRTDSEGDVSYWELVRFSTGNRTIEFKGLCLTERRLLGTSVNVSYRFGEPDHARAVPDDSGQTGLIVVGVIVAGLAVLGGVTSLVVIGVVAVGYAHFVVADRRRARAADTFSLTAVPATNEQPKVVR